MNFEALFPALNQFTYLNTAYSGLLSTEIANWRSDHDAKFLLGGSNFKIENDFIIDELRANLADFFDAEIAQTYLVPNFSFGFNTLINKLHANHRFLLLKEDYPNINNEVISNGFSYTEVKIDEAVESSIIDAITKFKPSIFAFSLVQYISGFSMDLAFIKKLKATYPDLLIIADGTQFSGTTNFSFANSGLDALLGSGYKWLLGGYGNGYLLLSEQLKATIYEAQIKKHIYERDFIAATFEPGHLDTLNFGTLNQGLKLLNSIGMDFVEKQTQEIAQKARNEFFARGLLSESDLNRKTQSTIINLRIRDLSERMKAEKILYSERGIGLRFAFHFYNTKEDLRKVLSVIDNNI